MSVEALPAFPLMDDEARNRLFERSDEACGCCGLARGWKFTGACYMRGDEPVLCPWCIGDGRAAAKFSCKFNELPYEEDGELSKADKELIMRRTPGFIAWQSNYWRACCGTACKFMGDATVADLRGRWASLVPGLREDLGKRLEWFDEWVTEYADYGKSPAAYVFECRKCSKLRFFWDYC